MTRKRSLDDTIRQYIFGQLPEDERREFEAQYLSDDDVYDRLLAAEVELIDAYVAGALSAQERGALEKTVLSSKDRDRKLAFSRALIGARNLSGAENAPAGAPAQTLSRTFPEESVFRRWTVSLSAGSRWAAVLAAMLVLSVAYWVLKTSAPGRVGPPLTVVLTAATRGGSTQNSDAAVPVKTLHPGNHPIQLQLRFEGSPYPAYDVEVGLAGGKSVVRRRGLYAQPRGHVEQESENQVSLTLPPESLRPGVYTVTLYGIKPDGSAEKMRGYALVVN